MRAREPEHTKSPQTPPCSVPSHVCALRPGTNGELPQGSGAQSAVPATVGNAAHATPPPEGRRDCTDAIRVRATCARTQATNIGGAGPESTKIGPSSNESGPRSSRLDPESDPGSTADRPRMESA